MPRYFALLRGINVGGHRVKMDRLRELVEALAFEQVETFIASGNVIFSSPSCDVPATEERIARHLQGALGYEVTTFIRSQSELDSIAAFQLREPFSTNQSARGQVSHPRLIRPGPVPRSAPNLVGCRAWALIAGPSVHLASLPAQAHCEGPDWHPPL